MDAALLSLAAKTARSPHPTGKGQERQNRAAAVPAPGSTIRDSSGKTIPKGWIGIDLDGTLAHFDHHSSIATIGKPVDAMLNRVKNMIEDGRRVKIFTARASDTEQLPLIRKWLEKNGLPELEITNIKDYNMLKLYDDRCVQVEMNTGKILMGNKSLGD